MRGTLRHWGFSAALLTALASTTAVCSAPRERVSPQAAAQLERDPRLARPVSVNSQRMYLGELVDHIRAETGVPLAVSDRLAPISGYELTLVVRNRPAWEVLEGLARLYSMPPDRWYWSRDRRGERETYTLRNTLALAEMQRLRRTLEENVLLEEHRRRREFFELPAAARDAAAAADPSVRTWNSTQGEGSFSLIAHLSAHQLRGLIRGTRVELRPDQLNGTQREHLDSMFERMYTQAAASQLAQEGKLHPVRWRLEDVTGMSIGLSRDSLGDLPTVTLRMASASGGTMTTTLLGGFQFLRDRAAHPPAEWIGEGEDQSAPASPVPADQSPAALHATVLRGRLDQALHQLATAAKIDLLYDRPVGRSAWFYVPIRRNLQGVLSEILGDFSSQSLMWKRRNELYLFRLADWSGVRRDLHVPWPVIRGLRTSARAHNGYLGLDDWIALASLSLEQRQHLRDQFGDVSMLDRSSSPSSSLLSLLRLSAGMDAGEREMAARPEGARWEDLSRSTQAAVIQMFGREQARNVRVLLHWNREARPPHVRWYLGTEDPLRQVRVETLSRWKEPQQPPNARTPAR